MTKTFRTTFINRFAPDEKVEIITRVTDKMEDRPLHKKAVAQMKATNKFDKEHKRYTEYKGKTVLLWTIKTEEVTQ